MSAQNAPIVTARGYDGGANVTTRITNEQDHLFTAICRKRNISRASLLREILVDYLDKIDKPA